MFKYARKRIYAIHLYNDYSGSPRVLADALCCLAKADYDCAVLTSQHEGFLGGGAVKRYIVPYFRSNKRWAVLLSYSAAQIYVFLLLSVCLVRDRLIRRESLALVNTMLPFGASLAAKLFGAQCIVYVHETSISPAKLKSFLRKVIECCADKVIFVSKYLAQVESFRRPECVVIYNGLRSDLVFSGVNDPQEKFLGGMILFCGSPKPYKGISKFFALAADLGKLNFIAALNCDESELEALAAGAPPNVLLLATPNNIASFYERAFLVVNLTDPTQCVETFGLSLLEGMAAGCPVVAPPVGGPLELVDDTVGARIDSNDYEALKSYIALLKEDYARWSSCSSAASARAKLFSADVYRRNIVNFFDNLN